MLYKVTLKGKKGKEEVYYMDENTLKSMKTDEIIEVERVKASNEDWRYDNKVL